MSSAQAGQRAVVLVDEYDKPILDALDAPEVARANRDFLRGLYAVIKDSDAHIRFSFITGVSKFSKVSLFSGLNNLTDITLHPGYSALCGYTEADLDTVFAPELGGLDRDRRSATGTTATVGAATRRSTTRSTSCCCSTRASSPPTGSRPARRRFWSTRCSRGGSVRWRSTACSAARSCCRPSTSATCRPRRCCSRPAT